MFDDVCVVGVGVLVLISGLFASVWVVCWVLPRLLCWFDLVLVLDGGLGWLRLSSLWFLGFWGLFVL